MREKPPGVGIEKIPIKQLIALGIANGHIDDGDPTPIGSLLPDWAIREFVTIEDFVDYDESPKDVVSYGVTSAGYDIRVGGVFKVFTNANCETVSPKHIPEDAFNHKDLTGHVWSARGQCQACDCLKEQQQARRLCPMPKPGTPASIKIPPNSFALAETVERLHIPRNVNCLCLGKSTYARCGIIMNFTPFEPGWRGIVTVEITNSTPLPVEIFAWQGIGQAQFQLMIGTPERSYAQKKNAKYQDQTGLTLPFCK